MKSCAYIQSWQQRKHSTISFDIAETRLYNYDTGGYGGDPKRQAKIYIFCLLHHTDPETINPLDASQWEFYVLPSAVLNEKLGKQKRMSLRTLIQLGGQKTAIQTLRSRIEDLNA